MLIRISHIVLLMIFIFGFKEAETSYLNKNECNLKTFRNHLNDSVLNFDSLKLSFQIKDSLEGGSEMEFLHNEYSKYFQLSRLNDNLKELIDSAFKSNKDLTNKMGGLKEIIYFSRDSLINKKQKVFNKKALC